MTRWRVIVVGGGPAGSAAALRLLGEAPELAGHVLLLEKAHHPRDKTCAGGFIPKGGALLGRLGVRLEVPQVRVDRADVGLPDGRRVRVEGRDICRVVRRRELDAAMVRAAVARGAVLRQDTRVFALSRESRGVRLETTSGSYWAPAVIGADGSGSVARRALVPGHGGRIARALMCDVPDAASSWDGTNAARYEFDFACVAEGVRGYTWAFPCLIGGVPHVNVGVYALPPADTATMRRVLDRQLARVGASGGRVKAFPIRTWTSASTLAAPGVLLAGDAAGADPLMGEGISLAIEYGMLAADTVLRSPTLDEEGCAAYARAVRGGEIGRKLRRLELATRLFYGPRWRLWFRVASASRRAQRIGLAWFNGVEDWDRRGPWAALAELIWPRGVARA